MIHANRSQAVLALSLVLAAALTAGCTAKPPIAPMPSAAPPAQSATVTTTANISASPAATAAAGPVTLAHLKLGLKTKWTGLEQAHLPHERGRRVRAYLRGAAGRSGAGHRERRPAEQALPRPAFEDRRWWRTRSSRHGVLAELRERRPGVCGLHGHERQHRRGPLHGVGPIVLVAELERSQAVALHQAALCEPQRRLPAVRPRRLPLYRNG